MLMALLAKNSDLLGPYRKPAGTTAAGSEEL
jgi:hypothetical protein